jgi:hypothetical protein
MPACLRFAVPMQTDFRTTHPCPPWLGAKPAFEPCLIQSQVASEGGDHEDMAAIGFGIGFVVVVEAVGPEVGIVRLPLASGLLAGKFTKATRFAENDHRNYNRDGACFNVGETFAGLPFETGVELADRIQRNFLPGSMTMVQLALRWILDHEAVSTVIPGAGSPIQARSNAVASTLPPLSDALHRAIADFYRTKVHAHIRGAY